MIRENIIELDRFSRLSAILEDWAVWQSRYTGIKSTFGSICMSSGYTASKTFEDLLLGIEDNICRLVEAAIDDLESGQRAAINQRYGITSVFRFPRGNYDDLLLNAHERLLVTLPKKGVVI